VRIRTKLFVLALIIAGGFIAETGLSIYTYREIVSIRGAIDRGVRLIAQARKTHGLMTDMVFDLFSPRLYSSLQGVILAPGGLTAQRQWVKAVDEFREAYTAFIDDPVLRSLAADEEVRYSFKIADTLSDRADQEFERLEADFSLIREEYKGSEELYSWLQLSKKESLIAVFDHMRAASNYLGSIFESYLERFVGILEQSAVESQRRALFLYVALSALLITVAVAFSLLVTRSILANVSLVDGAVERMAEGDFSSRVAPSGHDELGRLAERINLFSARLKSNVDSLSSLLGTINSAIPEDPDLDRILQIVTEALLQYEGVESSAICLIEDGRVARSAWAGFSPVVSWEILADRCGIVGQGADRCGTVGQGADRCGIVGQGAATFVVRDAALEAERAASGGLDPTLRSALAVPLVARHRVEGLCVFGRRGVAFNDLELTQFESFADYAAQVVDNAIANAALRARSDAEYRALQAQIQPHFMYNVLNGFVALNRMGDRGVLESSLHALRDMMRYTLEHAQRAAVREEFAFLEQYCRLQKLRFEDRFSFAFDLEDEAADLPIPKLLIQPFLENAFIHGIEPSTRPCTVWVSARVLEGELVITVEDDGVGCEPATIRERERIGIGNARERLSLLYSSATLRLDGGAGLGFSAKMAIPLAELEDRLGTQRAPSPGARGGEGGI
jgi:sensor histidine kinase YesM